MNKWIIGATLALAGVTATGGTIAADRAQDPYIDKGTHYELSVESDIAQDEKVLIAKDRAAMTLTGWRGEYAITITPQIPTAPTFGSDRAIDRPFTTAANRPLLSKKMEYRAGDVTAFIEPKAGTENEFDIDFTLHSKPDTNVFTYKIEGADDFDFFYQSALTAEEVAEGAERPENVIGSYAVYHKTKANHRIGSTNYGTGKAFHIYRPKAIDANGAEEWCSLAYEDGTLSVECSEKWLETAVYPVVVDPTLGLTSVGATGPAGAGANIMVGTRFGTTTPSADVLTNINVYNDANSAVNVKLGIIPWSTKTILANSVSAPIAADLNGAWQTHTYGTQPVLEGSTEYATMLIADATVSHYFYDSSGVDSTGWQDTTNSYSTPTNPTDLQNDSFFQNKYSLYATFTNCSTGTCTDEFRIPGFNTWTAPTGITEAIVACWGGGGGGADGGTSGASSGGGGAFASSTVSVTAGTQYTIFIGSGGAQGLGGTDSTFATTTVVADAGTGGTGSTANGVGGTVANSTGATKFAGGDGADGLGTEDTGAGGGGSAGPSGAGTIGQAGQTTVGGGGGNANGVAGNQANGGNAASGGVGTSASTGGNGGGGADNGLTGGGGGGPGGGGGGGEATGGAAGAGGQCTVTYTIAAGGGASSLDSGIIWFSDE